MALFPFSHGRGVSGRWPAVPLSAAPESPSTTGVDSLRRGISSSPIRFEPIAGFLIGVSGVFAAGGFALGAPALGALSAGVSPLGVFATGVSGMAGAASAASMAARACCSLCFASATASA